MDISENSNSIDNSKSEFIESTFEFIQTDSIQNSEEADKMTSFSIESIYDIIGMFLSSFW